MLRPTLQSRNRASGSRHCYCGRLSFFTVTPFAPLALVSASEDRPWGNTMWMMELLNEERAKAGEPLARHNNVLQATRKVMENLGQAGLLNFQETSYVDVQGRTQPMITAFEPRGMSR